ncbi:MAG: hypothetical protein U9R75_01380 [Candidatus Thermoplasmatota archaeon]|nr:hypothetical protein [Candidatus Thermoplasmatota archaeon]
MTIRKTRKIQSSLDSKGFCKSTTDHYWYVLYFNGKKTSVRTKISYGKKEYDDSLLSKMSGQLRITKKELLDLIDCPLGYEEYCNILLNKNILSK